MSITGTLNNWWYDDQYECYWGYIENDRKMRFSSDTYIHTSKVVKVEGDIVYTLNSVYKLGEPTNE